MSAVTVQEVIDTLTDAIDLCIPECGPYVITNFEVVMQRIEAHGIAPPDGFAIVPIEPTAGMVEAYSRASEQLTKNHLLSGSYPAIWQPIEAGYKAMLAAAKDKP